MTKDQEHDLNKSIILSIGNPHLRSILMSILKDSKNLLAIDGTKINRDKNSCQSNDGKFIWTVYDVSILNDFEIEQLSQFHDNSCCIILLTSYTEIPKELFYEFPNIIPFVITNDLDDLLDFLQLTF